MSLDQRVLTFLETARGPVTEGDVAAAAGVDVGTVKASLYRLMLSHESTLEVREDGTLVYDFGRELTRIGGKRWTDHARALGRWLWRGFSLVYKASLAVVLVVYAVTFLALILAAAVAASVASEDESPTLGAFRLVGLIFRGIFEFATHSTAVYLEVDRYGYAYKHYEPKGPTLPLRAPQPHAKGFIPSVYDFVLGPERLEPDERAQHRELASFVRERGGALTVADVQALSGLTREAAERLFARFVAEFEGEAEITDAGALVARFPELRRSRTTDHDEPIIHYWNEYEPPYEVTGNRWTRNLLIAALAGFNLACAGELLSVFGADGGWLWLGAVPAALFGLFFAIPAVRAPWVWWRNREQHRHNIRKRIFGAVFGTGGDTVSLASVVAYANAHRGDAERLDAHRVRALFEETLTELGGERDLDELGHPVADVSHLRREIAARQRAATAVEAAPTAYSTADDSLHSPAPSRRSAGKPGARPPLPRPPTPQLTPALRVDTPQLTPAVPVHGFAAGQPIPPPPGVAVPVGGDGGRRVGASQGVRGRAGEAGEAGQGARGDGARGEGAAGEGSGGEPR